MQIIVKKVGEPHEVRTIESLDIEDMQNMVGGLPVRFHVGNGVDMWLNDMGKIIALPMNLAIGSPDKRVLDTIHGDIFFAGDNNEGETIGLTDEQVGWVEEKLDSGYFVTQLLNNHLEFIPVWVFLPSAS